MVIVQSELGHNISHVHLNSVLSQSNAIADNEGIGAEFLSILLAQLHCSC